MAKRQGPLAGVVVLDLSRLLPGPYATQILADLGATVVKVEDPQGGDYLRHTPPLVGDHSAYFLALNRGKKSVALDLKEATAKAQFLDLVKTAHVVVESFRPGVLQRLGLGFDVLVQARPDLVLCSISGYGQEGPDAARAGHDLNFLARAGVLAYGTPGTQPAVQMADMAGGALWGVTQILAALRTQERDRLPTHIDVSMTDGAWSLLTMNLGAYTAAHQPLRAGQDLLNGGVPAYRVYLAQDGVPVSVAALEPKFWVPFCHALGCPELLGLGLSGGAEGAAVMERLQALFASRPSSQWRALFEPLDCCVEVAWAPQDAHRLDRTLSKRGLTVHVDQPGSGRVELPVTPVRMGGWAPPFDRPAPVLGQHNAELLGAKP